MTKDSTMRAVDELVAALAEHDGSDDFTAAAEMVRSAGLDVAYALATAALIGSARTKRRAATLAVERQNQRDSQPLHEGTGRAAMMPPRKGSKAYWRWVEETDEGAAWYAEDMAAREAADAKFADGLKRALDVYTREIRMTWEADLLASTFSLGDGTVVTWGDATVGQHEERAAMFSRNAAANAEGYARHQRAIEDLRESGAATLCDMISVAA